MMNKATFAPLCAACISSIVACAGTAFADGTVVAGGGSAQPGGTFNITPNNGPTLNGFALASPRLDAGKSYACTVVTQELQDDVSISPQIFNSAGQLVDNTANAVSLRGDVTPLVSSSTVGSATTTDDRIVITPVSADRYTFRINNNSTTDDVNAKFECMETTLYGGYNTNANPFNFLEVTNTSNKPVSGRVRGFNFDGTAAVNVTFTANANSRVDVDVHSAAGPNKYGVLFVTHDGPFGALQGAVSQYNGPVSALNLSASVPLRPRDQTF